MPFPPPLRVRRARLPQRPTGGRTRGRPSCRLRVGGERPAVRPGLGSDFGCRAHEAFAKPSVHVVLANDSGAASCGRALLPQATQTAAKGFRPRTGSGLVSVGSRLRSDPEETRTAPSVREIRSTSCGLALRSCPSGPGEPRDSGLPFHPCCAEPPSRALATRSHRYRHRDSKIG